MSWYDKLNSLLEPNLLLPMQRGIFSYTATGTTYLMAGWGTSLDTEGRLELRHPTDPLPLNEITLYGFLPAASSLLLKVKSFDDSENLYNQRMDMIDNMPTHFVSLTGSNQYKPLLLGAYGGLIRRMYNHDFDWIAAIANGTWYSLSNEIGDTNVDWQRMDIALRLPLDKRTISQVYSSSGREGEFPGKTRIAGGIAYVLLPKTWSCYPEEDNTIFRDDFMEANLDLSKWNRTQTGSGTVEIDRNYQWLQVKGNQVWGTNGLKSIETFLRGHSLVVDVFPTQTPLRNILMVGWTTGYDYNDFAHGLLFNQGSTIHVFENGINKGNVGSYSPGNIYRVRITLLETGARYEIQGYPFVEIGEDEWTLLSPSSTDGTATNLSVGATQWGDSDTSYLSDFKVYNG